MAFDKIRGSHSRIIGGVMMDDDEDNGEDDGDIKLPSTQTIYYCNCFDNFLDGRSSLRVKRPSGDDGDISR